MTDFGNRLKELRKASVLSGKLNTAQLVKLKQAF